MLAKHTFGSSPSAHNLVAILNDLNDKKITTNISRFLVSNNKIIHELKKIKDLDTKQTLTLIYRDSLYKVALKVPEKVKTHAINILVTRIRHEVFNF